MYEKEYVRGSILDRNGNTIAFSQKPGGTRTYSHPYAFSNLVGYWSKIYGTYGVEKTMNDVLVHSDCGNGDQEKRGADVTLTIDAALQEQAYKDIIAAVVAVPCRDLMAPPQLTADAPVAGVLHPVQIVLGEALGHELDLALFHALDGGLCQRQIGRAHV